MQRLWINSSFIVEPVVENFDLARIIIESLCCGREADTVLRDIWLPLWLRPIRIPRVLYYRIPVVDRQLVPCTNVGSAAGVEIAVRRSFDF